MLCSKYNFKSERTFETPCISLIAIVLPEANITKSDSYHLIQVLSIKKSKCFDANYCNKCIFLVPSIKRLSWLRRGRREWSFCARNFLVLVIFSDVISTVLIGDVCSPELMKIFKTLFPKLQNGHVVSACACAAWHVCVTAFSKRTCVLLTDLTVHHVSFLYSILHLARAKSEALVNICSFSNKTAK